MWSTSQPASEPRFSTQRAENVYVTGACHRAVQVLESPDAQSRVRHPRLEGGTWKSMSVMGPRHGTGAFGILSTGCVGPHLHQGIVITRSRLAVRPAAPQVRAGRGRWRTRWRVLSVEVCPIFTKHWPASKHWTEEQQYWGHLRRCCKSSV